MKEISQMLSRNDYMKILLEHGFTFVRSQKAYPGSLGEEDVYQHPEYKNQFYITRLGAEKPYGFNPQKMIGNQYKQIYAPNAIGNKEQAFWVDESFIELMRRLPTIDNGSVVDSIELDEALITAILPTIDNG